MSVASKVINLFVAGFIVAIMIPVAFSIFYSQQTEGWPATLASVWYMVPVLSMVALILSLIYYVFTQNQTNYFKQQLPRFLTDRKGELTPAAIVGMVVAVIIFAILMPTAVSLLVERFSSPAAIGASQNTPGVQLVLTLGQLLPLFLVLSIVIALILSLKRE